MDYNIYIHDKTSNQKPTQPRTGGGANTTPKTSESQSGGSNFLKSMTSSPAFLKTMKSSAVIAAFNTAYRIADGVIQKIVPYLERESGDYRFSITWNNFKSVMSAAFNPVGSLFNYRDFKQEIRLTNKKRDEERLLIGEIYTNNEKRNV